MFEDILGGLFGSTGGGTPQMDEKPPGGGTQQANPLASILLGVGAPLISSLMGGNADKKAVKRQEGMADTTSSIGEQLLKRAAAGQLTDPQQAQVDAMKKEQNAKNAQYLSSLGIPVSSAMVQGQNQVETNAVKLANDLINQSFQQGIQALNLGGPANQQIIQNAMKQREDLGKTISDVAGEIGHVMSQPGQKTGAPGADVSQGAQESISSGAQSWGAGDFDPYAGTIPPDVAYT